MDSSASFPFAYPPSVKRQSEAAAPLSALFLTFEPATERLVFAVGPKGNNECDWVGSYSDDEEEVLDKYRSKSTQSVQLPTTALALSYSGSVDGSS